MRLQQIQTILEAEVLVGYDHDIEVLTACGSDLISDILQFTKSGTVLLTGLPTLQMIKAAGLLDLTAIVFVRGKRPVRDVVALAQETQLSLLATKLPLYEACGRLYENGLQGCSEYLE